MEAKDYMGTPIIDHGYGIDGSDQGDRALLSFQRYSVLRDSRVTTHTHPRGARAVA